MKSQTGRIVCGIETRNKQEFVLAERKNVVCKNSQIKKLIYKGDKHSFNGRLKRLNFLLSIKTYDQFSTSSLASEYFEEARLCWYTGAFVATILMIQIAFEELLRSFYRMANGVGGKLCDGTMVDGASFYQLVEQARRDRIVLNNEMKLLHNLRKVRNPYVHTKDIKIGEGNWRQQSNFLTQELKIISPELIGADVEHEAKNAIRLLMT